MHSESPILTHWLWNSGSLLWRFFPQPEPNASVGFNVSTPRGSVQKWGGVQGGNTLRSKLHKPF